MVASIYLFNLSSIRKNHLFQPGNLSIKIISIRQLNFKYNQFAIEQDLGESQSLVLPRTLVRKLSQLTEAKGLT